MYMHIQAEGYDYLGRVDHLGYEFRLGVRVPKRNTYTRL